jgi:hypothetical protein
MQGDVFQALAILAAKFLTTIRNDRQLHLHGSPSSFTSHVAARGVGRVSPETPRTPRVPRSSFLLGVTLTSAATAGLLQLGPPPSTDTPILSLSSFLPRVTSTSATTVANPRYLLQPGLGMPISLRSCLLLEQNPAAATKVPRHLTLQ